MIHGIGIDIVDVSRFKRAVERWGDKFCKRVFTVTELDYCFRQRFPERHLAARFAAKVSLFKALGKSLNFKDVEVTRGPDGPKFKVSGLTDVFNFTLSITHDRDLSIAETIVEGE